MSGFRDVCSSSESVNVMIGESSPADEEGGDNAAAAALSSEDSSSPDGTVAGTELDLALCLSVGRNHLPKVRSFSSSFASSSSSLTRESGTKRSADSSAAVSKGPVAVGWPPLRTYRINSLVNQAKSLPNEDGLNSNIVRGTTTKNGVVAAKNDEVGFIKPPMLVKVTMDGVIIGRKIDLNALDSYEALAKTLEQMFFHTPSSVTTRCKGTRGASELLDGSSEYIITYQDKDGDWMLVGDVPWLYD
ncbi:Auxin-responsive protein IAA10 [Hirschfeldia incana]|nr:Auxin-responsive protein IAA10 [Hirschfeldia incana]